MAGPVFDALTGTGAQPLGHYAVDACRIEKGFVHWGHDVGPEVTPLEAGLGFTIDWDKEFVGKPALQAQRKNFSRHLCLFEVSGAPLLLHDELIREAGQVVGLTTSGAQGARTGKALCFGLIDIAPGETRAATAERQFRHRGGREATRRPRAHRSALRPQRQKDARMTRVQVLIIGGGAMGVSLLYHLTKAGWSDVMLVEKNDLTHGSTWHAAGLCTHFAHNPTIQELRATSVRLYRDILPEETGQSCGFHRSGAMRITRNPDRMDEFRHVAGLSDFTGYPLEILTPERIAELHPLAQFDGLLGGIYEPDDGHVDPSLATNAMAQVAQRGGAAIRRFSPVQAIRREGAVWRVETAKGMIEATHIVNAAGTWGWEVGHMMGLNIPSVPVLHQYLVTDTVPEVAERQAQGLPELPIIRDPEESWYVRQERDGLILGPL